MKTGQKFHSTKAMKEKLNKNTDIYGGMVVSMISIVSGHGRWLNSKTMNVQSITQLLTYFDIVSK